MRIRKTDESVPSGNLFLFDFNGHKLFSEKNVNSLTELNVSLLPTGSYLLRCDKQTFTILKD